MNTPHSVIRWRIARTRWRQLERGDDLGEAFLTVLFTGLGILTLLPGEALDTSLTFRYVAESIGDLGFGLLHLLLGVGNGLSLFRQVGQRTRRTVHLISASVSAGLAVLFITANPLGPFAVVSGTVTLLALGCYLRVDSE